MTLQLALANAIEPILDACIKHISHMGIRISNESRGTNKVTITLHSTSLNCLNVAKTKFKELLMFTEVSHKDKKLLFSVGARHNMQTLANNETAKGVSDRFYVYWDQSISIVRVYGSNTQRERGIAELKALIDAIKIRLVNKVFVIKRFHRRDVKTSLSTLKESSKVEELVLRGFQLNAFGEVAAVAKVESLLLGKLEEENKKLNCDIQQTDCCVCYCELDAEYFELMSCGHKGCKSCLELLFYGAEVGDTEMLLPIKCPICKPNMLWALSDVVSIASDRAWMNIKQAAVSEFALKNPGSVKNCPVPGCNQLIKLSGGGGGGESKDERSVYCDQCSATYCYPCTEKMQFAVDPHDGTCENNCLRMSEMWQ